MKHLTRLALVALFIAPFSLCAERSIMDPVVYDLRGALAEGYEVAAVVTDAGELSEFTFDTANSYLTLLKPATFYYALCVDTAGQLAYLYMGPKAALDQGDGFAVLLGVLTGLLVASVGAAISLAAGLIKGTKVALDNRAEIQQREARRNSSPPSNTQFVVEPVDERLVPAEFTTALKQAIGR